MVIGGYQISSDTSNNQQQPIANDKENKQVATGPGSTTNTIA